MPATRLGHDRCADPGLEAAARVGAGLPPRATRSCGCGARAEVLRLTNIRANQNRKMGDPGPEGSIGKMAGGRCSTRGYLSQVMDLLGAEAMLYGSYEMIRPETAMGADTLQKAFLRSRANTIEGGTTEVMANILGERVLGLPGDVRVDRDVPWSEVPRN